MSTMPTNALQPLDKQVEGLSAFLDKLKPQMALALPKHMTAERMARIVLTQIRKTPKLLQCDRMSLAASIMTAAQLGLEVDGIEAHLVPFENRRSNRTECQLIADYKGLAKLAWQSEMVTDMRARCVYEGDEFKHVLGDDEKIIHVPITPGHARWPKKDEKPVAPEDREILAAYAIVKIIGGGIQREVVQRYELEALREKQAGPSRDSKRAGPWWTNFDAMSRKTALRRALKLVPRSASRASRALQTAVVVDEQAEAGIAQDFVPIVDVEALPQRGALAQLTARLNIPPEGGVPPGDSTPASGSSRTIEPDAPDGVPPSTQDEELVEVEGTIADAPPCHGCGKNDPPPEGVDLAGRAWHGACLRVLQIQATNRANTKPAPPTQKKSR